MDGPSDSADRGDDGFGIRTLRADDLDLICTDLDWAATSEVASSLDATAPGTQSSANPATLPSSSGRIM